MPFFPSISYSLQDVDFVTPMLEILHSTSGQEHVGFDLHCVVFCLLHGWCSGWGNLLTAKWPSVFLFSWNLVCFWDMVSWASGVMLISFCEVASSFITTHWLGFWEGRRFQLFFWHHLVSKHCEFWLFLNVVSCFFRVDPGMLWDQGHYYLSTAPSLR